MGGSVLGEPIAHAHITLSSLPHLRESLPTFDTGGVMLNGYSRVRFPAPVRSGRVSNARDRGLSSTISTWVGRSPSMCASKSKRMNDQAGSPSCLAPVLPGRAHLTRERSRVSFRRLVSVQICRHLIAGQAAAAEGCRQFIRLSGTSVGGATQRESRVPRDGLRGKPSVRSDHELDRTRVRGR